MNTKTPIKVVKRHARQQESAAEETPNKKTTQQSARDMVATVSEWVNEFQQNRRRETTRALKTLFSETTPQTSKA